MSTEKPAKRSYYLPVPVVDAFKLWCKPGRDLSPKIAGAMLLWMALDTPELKATADRLRQELVKLAYKAGTKKSVTDAGALLLEAFAEAKALHRLDSLGAKRSEVLAAVERAIKGVSAGK